MFIQIDKENMFLESGHVMYDHIGITFMIYTNGILVQTDIKYE